MADILLDEQSAPATPASGTGALFIDSVSSIPGFINDGGRKGLMAGSSFNASIAAQSGFAADTYLTDSDLLIPSFGFQARTMFRWRISVSKTAAGVATPIFTVRIGAARTVSDTSRLVLTGPAQTAAADVGVYDVLLVVRNVGASGVLQGTLLLSHNGAAVGLASNDASAVEGTSAGFDNAALMGQYISLSINAGASAAWTISQVRAEAMW